jgi:hypothetical protein
MPNIVRIAKSLPKVHMNTFATLTVTIHGMTDGQPISVATTNPMEIGPSNPRTF